LTEIAERVGLSVYETSELLLASQPVVSLTSGDGETDEKQSETCMIRAKMEAWKTKEMREGFCIRFDIYFADLLCYAVRIM
jgi:hypothetical protein